MKTPEPGLHGELPCFCGVVPDVFGPEITESGWVVGCGSFSCAFSVVAPGITSDSAVSEWNRLVRARPRPCLCGTPVVPVVSERTGDVIVRCRNNDCPNTPVVSSDQTDIAVREWNDLIQTPVKKEKK